MIKALAFCFAFFGMLSASSIAEKAVTLASFLETISAPNDHMKEIINASFESVSYKDIKGVTREIIGNTTIVEYCFDAYQKGKVGPSPDFLVFLEVAWIQLDKDGLPNIGSEYPASIDLKLVGFRVAAWPPSDRAKLMKE